MREHSFYPLRNKAVVRSTTMDSSLLKAQDKAVVMSATMDSKLLKTRKRFLTVIRFATTASECWRIVPRKRAATKF